jgi:hypothetical protein
MYGFFKSNTLDRNRKKKKKFALFHTDDKKGTQSEEDSEIEPENSEGVPSYELVVDHKSKKYRFR